MPKTDTPPPAETEAGPLVYVVPAWMAVYGAAMIIGATILLLWASPAAGIVVTLTTVAVALAGLGATPRSIRARIGALADLNAHLTQPAAPPAAGPEPADSGALVRAGAIHRVLQQHGLSYEGRNLHTTEIRTLADRYWKRNTPSSRNAAEALDALIERAENARAARRAAQAQHEENGVHA